MRLRPAALHATADKAQALLQHAACRLRADRVPSQKGGATSTFDEAYDLKDWAAKTAINASSS